MTKITPSLVMGTSPYEWDNPPPPKSNEAYISAIKQLVEYIIGMDTLRINV